MFELLADRLADVTVNAASAGRPASINEENINVGRNSFFMGRILPRANVAVTSDANGSPLSVSLSGKGSMLSPHTVSLTWGASPSVVAGYHIYRSTTDGTGYAPVDGTLISTLDYTDSTVFTGTTYYYVATAVDDTGSESVYSDQASAVIP